MALTLATGTRNAMCDACVDLVDVSGAGQLIIYTAAASALATFTLNSPAFGDASTGVATMDVSGRSTTATDSGTADNATLKTGGTNTVMSGLTVGTTGTNVILDTTTIVSGQTVNLTAGTVTQPAS